MFNIDAFQFYSLGQALRSSISMPPPSPRPLAPAPARARSAGTGSPEITSAGLGNTPTGSTKGIRRASTACQNCKQIKRKCDQARPCSNCRKLLTSCVYNEADDGRRKAARKRTVESLELKSDALDSILDSLRNSDESQSLALLQLIRSDASLQAIVECAKSHTASSSASQSDLTRSIISDQPRRAVLSVNDLCDTPLVRVPAYPWTTVSDDSEFISHLMSVYFTWYYLAYPLVDKTAFLRDMGAGILDCEHCSPLLVNAMLVIACHFSDHPMACPTPSDASTRGARFFEEAVDLWNAQAARPALINVQAASLLAVASTLVGKDRMAWGYVEQMNRMQRELSAKNIRIKGKDMADQSSSREQLQGLVSSTSFLISVGFGVSFMHHTNLTPPAVVKMPFSSILEESVQWCPYPRQAPEIEVTLRRLHIAYYDLHLIGFDIQDLLFNEASVTQRHSIHVLDKKLQEWKQDLPGSLQILGDVSPISPPVMDLHLAFHWFRVTLFNFIESKRPESFERPSISSTQSYIRDQSIECAREVARLCQRYDRDFRLKQLSIWMPQTTASVAYLLLDMLHDPVEKDSVSEIFHQICLVLIAASQRWFVMKGHVRMIYMTAKERGLKLQRDTSNVLESAALDQWHENEYLNFASASHPNYAVAKEEGPRLAAMGDLLEKWANYGLEED